MKVTYHLIQELEGGVPSDPILFYDKELAGALFEQKISDPKIDFRKKLESESWEDFENAFHDYTYSDEVGYDTCDWEIHWYKILVEDHSLVMLIDLYFAIVNHATIETLVDEDVRARLKSVERVIEKYGIKE